MENNAKRKRKWYWLLLLLLLILLTIWYFFSQGYSSDIESDNNDSLRAVEDSINRAKAIADSLYREEQKKDSILQAQAHLDSIRFADSANRASRIRDSLNNAQRVQDSLARERRRIDSLKRAQALLDSLSRARAIALKDSLDRKKAIKDSIQNAQRVADSLKMANDPCVADTIIPWVYPKPSGGLHPKPVNVAFVSTEKCDIYWKFEGEASFKKYDGKKFVVNRNSVILYKATDPCGNEFSQKRKRYEIAADNNSKCPKGMSYIPANGGFCIDKYEWPNVPGKKPQSNVSFSQASDSCFTIGKRLCESKEWESCCRGPYNWNYPYGQNYLSRACVTENRAKRGAGKAGECRGWYDVYDLVGNLAEWTATKSIQKSGFYVVKGGYWESGTRSSCNLSRHSYFPQNPHNPVGFRCCKDIDE